MKVGCPYRAIGMMVFAWSLAQKTWLKHKGVPIKKWPDDLNLLIECGLAEAITAETSPKHDRIYIKGSRNHFLFLEKMSLAGQKGGKSKHPNKLKNLKQYRKDPSGLPKGSEISNSNSNSINNNTSSNSAKATFEPLIEEIYKNKYPRKEGKSLGLKKLKLEIKTEQDLALFDQAVTHYAEHKAGKDEEFIKLFSTFAKEWRDWIEKPQQVNGHDKSKELWFE